MLLRCQDIFGQEINLSEKQWEHIISEHPEAEPYLDEVAEVLKAPQYIKRSKSDSAVWLYYRFYERVYSGKYLLVVVKRAEPSFVITFYVTDRIKTGETLWPKR